MTCAMILARMMTQKRLMVTKNVANITLMLLYEKFYLASPGSHLVSQLLLPYIGIAKYSDKCDSVITAEIKLENC